MYVTPDFATKKAFKEAVDGGQLVLVFDTEDGNGEAPADVDWETDVRGPHDPEQNHRWTAHIQANGAQVTKVLS